MKKLIFLASFLIGVNSFAQSGDFGVGGYQGFKDPAASPGTLPTTGNTVNDVRASTSDNNLYIWTGSSWSCLSCGAGGGAVTSFNSRTGAVTLSNGDVLTAIGFTPENVANKSTSLASPNNTTYPTTLAVSNAIASIPTPTPAPTPPVTSVSNSDGTLTISPSTGAVIASRSAITGDISIPASSNSASLTATTNSTLTTLSALALPWAQLSGTTPTWNQNTTGTSANFTATTNTTLVTASALSLPYSQLTGTPTPIPNYVPDSGSGGVAGLVPAPPQYSAQMSEFYGGGGLAFVDQSKTIQPSFSFAATGAAPSGAIKYENTIIFTSITTGKPYAIGTGFIGSPTLSLWDISDQTNPINVGNFTAAGGGIYNVSVVTLSGVQYAVVGYNSGSHFVVVNITNPSNPVQTSSTVLTGSPGSLYGVSCPSSGAGYGYCYVASQSAGLIVMDLTSTGTPAAPAQVFTQAGGNKSFGVVAIGSNVYTTLYSTSSPYTVRQIVSWSIATPSTPSQLQSLQVTQQGEALGMSVFGNTAFVTTAYSGHYYTNLVDITTPSSMTNLSNVTSSNNFGSAFYAVASGNVMYVSSGSNATYGGAIDAYDISTRTNPIHIAQVTEGVANDVFGNPALYGGYIFVANYGNAAGTSGNLQVYTQAVNNLIAQNVTASHVVLPGGDVQSQINAISSGSTRISNTVTSNFSIPTLTKDYVLNADSSGGAIAVTLPDAVASANFCTDIKNIGSPVNNVTISGVQTIDGSASFVQTLQNQSTRICSINSLWFVY